MATFSQGDWLWLYALLPLITTAGTGASIFMSPGRWQAPLLLVCGGVPLLASLVPLHSEAEILGIIHLPMTWEGGAMLFVVIIAVALVAAANHIYKLSAPFLLLRLGYGLGGLVLLLATCLALVAPPWNNWALYLLYLLLMMVAGIALKGTFRGPPGDDLTGWVGLLLRAVLVWTPIAAITSQSSYSDPFVTYVVESDGGVLPTVIASLKCYASYYAMAIAIAVGLAGLLAQRADRISSPHLTEETVS
jgi:hypothetical protein